MIIRILTYVALFLVLPTTGWTEEHPELDQVLGKWAPSEKYQKQKAKERRKELKNDPSAFRHLSTLSMEWELKKIEDEYLLVVGLSSGDRFLKSVRYRVLKKDDRFIGEPIVNKDYASVVFTTKGKKTITAHQSGGEKIPLSRIKKP